MLNLLLTTACNRSCPYCFARERMGRGVGTEVLSMDDLETVADLARADGVRQISLIGGEPTLHPRFTAMLQALLDRGLKIRILTNGCLDGATLESLSRIVDRSGESFVTFLVNVNDPEHQPPRESKQQNRFLDRFRGAVTTSFNLYHPHAIPWFLLDVIQRYELDRTLRLGVAHPILGATNQYLSPADFRDTFARLVPFMENACEQGIRCGFDCGFTRCDFDDEALDRLAAAGVDLSFCCGVALDIGPGPTCWPCFPLSGFETLSLSRFASLAQAHQTLANLMEARRRVGARATASSGWIYDKCESCHHRASGECAGGCLAHVFVSGDRRDAGWPVEG